MSKLLKFMKNTAYTENGAITNPTSDSAVLDLFAVAGAVRSRTETDICDMVEKAAKADLELTLKLLFWTRDVLQGAGERRFFRVAFKYLESIYGEKLAPVVPLIPTYGRWDDLEILLDCGPLEGVALQTIAGGLRAENGLAAKWLPRQGAIAAKVRKHLGLGTPREFRKLLVGLTNVVETPMCAGKWGEIEYGHVPARAAQTYRRAFQRHDTERYAEYVAGLAKGETKVNAKSLYPYQVVKAALTRGNTDTELALLDAQWAALPDFLVGNLKRVLPVVDVSGSMFARHLKPMPIEVSVSLGLYVAERNTGIFKNAFVTFSQNPQVVYIEGKTLVEKVESIREGAWGLNTDLIAVFDLLLAKAGKHKLSEEEMPQVILIMSDMEFDSAISGETNYEAIQRKYKKSGYKLPKIVFWNLAARNPNNFPVVKTDEHTAMISGFSPSILAPVLRGEIPDPWDTMLEVLNSERYRPVTLPRARDEAAG